MSGLFRFRWMAIGFLILGTAPLTQWGYLQSKNIPYFIAVLALLSVFNVLSFGLWQKDGVTSQNQILVQLWVDLLAASGLLFVSGSASNPFICILCIHAFLGGMLLSQMRSYIFGASVLLLLSLLQIETYFDAQVTLGIDRSQMFLSFLSQWVLVSGAWFVSHYFSGVLQENEKKIRLLQNRQHQTDRLKSLGALTAGFSHQLATPMNSLKLRMERGLRKLHGEESLAREEFEKAQASLDECVSVFHHMASVFSRSAEVELQRVDMKRLVQDLLEVWSKENGPVIVHKQIEEGDLFCRLQILAFSQTFFDLLNNALEASTEGKAIHLRLYKKPPYAVIEIVDAGSGISAEILSRLGEPFVTSKEDGNGLGLYSAAMMAQAAGGEFRIFNNSSGRGVTAQVTLPLEGAL